MNTNQINRTLLTSPSRCLGAGEHTSSLAKEALEQCVNWIKENVQGDWKDTYNDLFHNTQKLLPYEGKLFVIQYSGMQPELEEENHWRLVWRDLVFQWYKHPRRDLRVNRYFEKAEFSQFLQEFKEEFGSRFNAGPKIIPNNVVSLQEVIQHRRAMERDTDSVWVEKALKNPICHLQGGLIISTQNDGMTYEMYRESTGEMVVSDVSLPRSLYLSMLTISELERKILHLRSKYEPQTIDMDKAPSNGVSQEYIEPTKEEPHA